MAKKYTLNIDFCVKLEYTNKVINSIFKGDELMDTKPKPRSFNTVEICKLLSFYI